MVWPKVITLSDFYCISHLIIRLKWGTCVMSLFIVILALFYHPNVIQYFRTFFRSFHCRPFSLSSFVHLSVCWSVEYSCSCCLCHVLYVTFTRTMCPLCTSFGVTSSSKSLFSEIYTEQNTDLFKYQFWDCWVQI